MRVRVAGVTGRIGLHVINIAIEMGHHPVALVRNRRNVKLRPHGGDIFYGDVSMPETFTNLSKESGAVIFTPGFDGLGCMGARAIDYGGVRNILQMFKDTFLFFIKPPAS